MKIDENNAAWIETVALGLVSAFLFQSGIFALVFLIPLQFLWTKRGPNSFFLAAIIAVAGILGAKLVQAVGLAGQGVDYWLLFADLLLPVGLVVGLYVVDYKGSIVGRRLEGVYRLLAGTGVAVVVTIPLFAYMASRDVVATALGQQLAMLEGMLGPESGSIFVDEQARERLVRLAMDVLYGTLASGLCMVLALNWYVGTRIARRFVEQVPEARRIRIPQTLVWPFVGTLGVAALTLVVELGFLKYIVWNASLVFAFLYGVQGFAVARHLLNRYNVSSGLQFVLSVVAVMLLFVPGLNLIVVIGLPGLGLSEVWVRYNRGVER